MDRDPIEPGKLCNVERLVVLRTQARQLGERVVHCHGCFDIVHPGHVRHLEHARRLGDRLIVSITADEFVDKGAARPLFDERLRAENLAALSCVDWVIVSPSATAVELLGRVEPDVYVKGAEYEHNNDPRFAAERDAVEGAGGRVVFSSGDVVFSSTALIDAMSGDGGPLGAHQDDAGAVAYAGLIRSMDLTPDRVRSELDRLRGSRVVVIGESIIDTYVDCAWPEVTSESPVLSLRPRQRRSFDGGAAIVAAHLAAAGARPTLISPIPRDTRGLAMRRRLEAAGVEVDPVAYEGALPEKERFLVGREKVVKLDHTSPIELDNRTRNALIGSACEHARDADAAIVTDFGLGMFGPKLTADLFAAIRPLVGFLAGDVSGTQSTLLHMCDADWLTPSERELRGSVSSRSDSLPAVAYELVENTRAEHVALTLADEGVVVFRRREMSATADGQPVRLSGAHTPSLNRAPMDTLGCGDAFLAYSSAVLAAGGDTGIGAYIGSLAAAVCGSTLGNSPCDPERLIRLASTLYTGATGRADGLALASER